MSDRTPLTPAEIAAAKASPGPIWGNAFHGSWTITVARLCDSHELLRERAERAEAELEKAQSVNRRQAVRYWEMNAPKKVIELGDQLDGLKDCIDEERAAHAKLATILRARIASLEAERDEAIGIGSGANDGWPKNCTCGRRMVWQYAVNVTADEPGAPAWVCPNCVFLRVRDAEAELAAMRPVVEAAVAEHRATAQYYRGNANDDPPDVMQRYIEEGWTRFDALVQPARNKLFDAVAAYELERGRSEKGDDTP